MRGEYVHINALYILDAELREYGAWELVSMFQLSWKKGESYNYIYMYVLSAHDKDSPVHTSQYRMNT